MGVMMWCFGFCCLGLLSLFCVFLCFKCVSCVLWFYFVLCSCTHCFLSYFVVSHLVSRLSFTSCCCCLLCHMTLLNVLKANDPINTAKTEILPFLFHILFFLFKTWCLHYPQCNLTTEWHHWRQLIWICAVSSGATKGFILLFRHLQ